MRGRMSSEPTTSRRCLAATWLTAHATQQSTQQQSDPSSWSSYGDFYNGAWMLLADWIIRNNTVVVSDASVTTLLT